MTTPTQSDRYKGLLLAMCKYHQNIKDEAQFLRETADESEDPKMSFGLHRKANLLSEQRKAILWMLKYAGEQDEEISVSLCLSWWT